MVAASQNELDQSQYWKEKWGRTVSSAHQNPIKFYFSELASEWSLEEIRNGESGFVSPPLYTLSPIWVEEMKAMLILRETIIKLGHESPEN